MGEGTNGETFLVMSWKQKMKYSRLFGLYERLFRPGVWAAHRKEVELYRGILGGAGPKGGDAAMRSAALIFDIGAYDGHKTAAFLEMGARVVACEPDAYNFRLLNVRFRRRKKRVTLLNAAVGDHIGTGFFLVHHLGSAFNTLNRKWKEMLEADGGVRWKEDIRFSGDGYAVRVTTVDELIRLHGMPDFIKIDVEGYEKQVFEGLSQRVPCVSFECQLPEFRDDLLAILQKLTAVDGATRFNIVYEEELVFPEFVEYDKLLEWIAGTQLFSFDIVAMSLFGDQLRIPNDLP
jgi:FkbM family methyltransferase